ncbi:hypothetical protein PUN28_010603 [Cardiocondyla obscurior]|uniref:Uncharacterized protein n=1 Tax=Cardiocondyla obscurior TaxID=286306 RepID=A0AAW2FKC1_9HYME
MFKHASNIVLQKRARENKSRFYHAPENPPSFLAKEIRSKNQLEVASYPKICINVSSVMLQVCIHLNCDRYSYRHESHCYINLLKFSLSPTKVTSSLSL